MPLVVQKYGGTSVGSIKKIKTIAKKIVGIRNKGNDLVVVVSAMGGETDKLFTLASQITDTPPERELDSLLSSGERVSAALLSMAINSLGHKALSFSGRQVGIITDDLHTKARIKKIAVEKVKKAIKDGFLVIAAGFQGISEVDDDVTTLGRGGSDLTAVALAASLKAKYCEIYTDVEGVYTCDPNIVSEAKKIDKISFEEMLEMASLGAKVLQTRSVEFAKKYNVPIVVKSTFVDGKGTLVTKEDKDMEKEIVSSVTYDKNQAKITLVRVPDQPGIASRIFETVAEKKFLVDMIIQNTSDDGFTDLSFTVPRKESNEVLKTMQPIAEEIKAKNVTLDKNIVKVSIVGVGMRSHSGVASKLFTALAGENVNIMMITTSEIKISCVIDEKYTELALRVIHKAFGLAK